MPARDIYDVISAIPWPEVGSWTLAQIGTFIVTGIAAFVGVDHAFKHERKKREEDIAATRAAAIRRALFALTRAHGFIATLDQEFCQPIRQQPVLKLLMKPFLNTGFERWYLEIESLDFLLETDYRQVMLDVHGRETSSQLLHRLMLKRSETVAQTIQPAIARLFPPDARGVSHPDLAILEREVGMLKLYEVEELSGDILKLVEEEMALLPKLQADLRKAAGDLFPAMNFQYLGVLVPQAKMSHPTDRRGTTGGTSAEGPKIP